MEGMKMQALNIETSSSPLAGAEAKIGSPGYQAYRILHFGFAVAPIVAGLDKFFGLLVNWDQYLPSFVNNMVGGHGHSLMYLVGVIEIIAGLGVWFKPRIFAYVVAAWLFLIIGNLLMIPGYFDVALRDIEVAGNHQQVADDQEQPSGHDVGEDPRLKPHAESGDDLDHTDQVHQRMTMTANHVVDERRQVLIPVDE